MFSRCGGCLFHLLIFSRFLFRRIFRFFDRNLIQRLHNISCKRTLFIDDCCCDAILDVRLQLLRLQLSIEMEDFEMANDLLNHINTYFTDATTATATTTSPSHRIVECIRLPNQIYCKSVDRWIIGSEMKLIKCLQLVQQQQRRQQQQKNHQWQWQQCTLELLLTHRQCNFESKYLNTSQQYEMLVEWHWHAERFDECLYWCEMGLSECVRSAWSCTMLQCKQIASKTTTAAAPFEQQFWQHIRFLTVYIEHLVDENQSGMYIVYAILL